jgi:hypothetical protein
MERTTHQLKTISREAIPRAIQKAERYRLLNQSWATESICLDILEVEPDNQQVLVMLLLSLTDQFAAEPGALVRRAQTVLARLADPYQKLYYAGIIDERLGHAKLEHAAMHGEAIALRSFRAAMDAYDQAERIRQPGNDDAILRWNTCARAIERMHQEEEADAEFGPNLGE